MSIRDSPSEAILAVYCGLLIVNNERKTKYISVDAKLKKHHFDQPGSSQSQVSSGSCANISPCVLVMDILISHSRMFLRGLSGIIRASL